MNSDATSDISAGKSEYRNGLWIGRTLRGLILPLAFGFLLAERGLPLLPWGESLAIGAALALYTVGALRLLASMEEIVTSTTADAVFGVLFVPLFLYVMARPSAPPSIVALGGAVAGIVWGFQNKWAAGGLVFGMVIGMGLFTLGRPGRVQREFDMLSGGEFSREAGQRGFLKLAVLLLVVAGWQLTSRRLRQRDRERASARHAAERARDAERTAIARELHDVIAHHVSVMTLHAEGASTKTSGPAKSAMLQVAESGRAALSELRRVLGVLRHGSDPVETVPQPGLSDLEELVRSASATGIKVNLEKRGRPSKLTAGDELCLYRVVQEALTNARRHSAAQSVDLILEWADDQVQVIVEDPGPARASPRSGTQLGLAGMRERVELRGGTVSAGPRQGGGFRVEARIPLTSSTLAGAG